METKTRDLAIMDAIDAVDKVDEALNKEEHDVGNDPLASRDMERGKLNVVKWTLRSLLS